MKKTFSFLLALCLVLSFGVTAFAVVEPSESFYAADYANVLTNSTEASIVSYNGALEQQCQGAQIVVVTVDYLDGMSCDTYAYQLFNDWGVGSSEYNNGMLLLLAVQENKAWLAYGLGLTSHLSTGKVDKLLDNYFWTDFDKGNYDRAVGKLFTALLEWYDGVYGSSVVSAGQNAGTGSVPQTAGSQSNARNRLGGLIRVVVLIAILMALSGGFGGRRRGFGGILPWLFLFNSRSWNPVNRRGGNWPPRGGGGFSGGGGFGGGMGRGGGGFSGGGGGRR